MHVRDEATATLRRLALGIHERDVDTARDRLLERIAMRDDCEPLRDALVLIGARTVVRPIGALLD